MFLAWLLLLAIPLQGLAAASMLHCGSGSGSAAPARSAGHPHHHPDGSDRAVAMGHGLSHHQHAGHDHSADESADVAAASVDSTAGSPAVGGALPHADHKCSVCAACCHAAAISDPGLVLAAATAPQAVRVEPFVAVPGRPGSVPDKPPRA